MSLHKYMDSRDIHHNYFPVFFITSFFIFFGLITTACCQDCRYSCSCYHWEDDWPLFCYDKGFKLELHDGKLHTLEMVDGVIYRVLDINESAHTMKLVREDIYDDTCFALQHRRVNTTLNTALLNYGADVHNLTLSYRCGNLQQHKFSSPFTVRNNAVELFLEQGTNCSEASVQVPVLDPFVPIDHDWEKLKEVLQSGFLVDYTVKKREGINWKVKVAIGLGTGFGSIIAMLVLFYFYLRRKKRKDAAYLLSRNISSDPSSRVVDFEKSNHLGVHLFSYFELEEATNNFDSAKELGDGGFGTVYYGKLRDGRAVAVKRLYEHNFKRVEQFLNEVEILTRLRHKNLVSLYGCTSRHSRELLLVYEYISNGTVADHLHGDRAKPGSLPLCTRLKIAVETASALSYLHASDIIHRDVKTNNILLDEHFCVKVADFGLSRLFPTNVTHVSTAPQGTPGYVDPDYHQCYQLTDKSDVYSFGVVLIELISSMPAVDITRHRHEINLSNLAIGKIQGKAVHELVDPALGYGVDGRARRAVEAVAELAFGCLQGEKDLRPSMVEVLEALKRIQSEMCDTEEVVLSPGSVGMGWSSSNDTTPNASL